MLPLNGWALKVLVGLQVVGATYAWYRLGSRIQQNKENGELAQSNLNKPRLKRRLSIFNAVKVPKENPFDYEAYMVTQWERLWLSVGSVTLLPIRVALLLPSILAAGFFAKVSILGISNEDLCTKPLSSWRKYFQWYTVRPMFRLTCFFMGFLWFEEEGTEHINSSAAKIVVSNHRSFVEPAYYMYKFMATPIAAAENLKIPIVTSIVSAIQTITVDRNDANSKKNVIEQIAIRSRSKNGEWPQILIFPEGTCTNGKSMISFKSGAFIPGVPVQPCVFTFPAWTPFGIRSPDPSWVYAGIQQPEIFFRMLSSPWTRMRIKFLPIYTPRSPHERADLQVNRKDSAAAARRYGDAVRQLMCNALGVRGTDHSVEDVLLQKEALKNQFKVGAGILNVEYRNIQKMFHVDLDTIKVYQEAFRQVDVDKSGDVTLNEFLKVYNAPDERVPELIHLFRMLDNNDDGVINFQEYLLGLALLTDSSEGKSEEEHHERVLRVAFRIIDSDEDEVVSKQDVQRVLLRTFENLSEDEFTVLFDSAGGGSAGLLDFKGFKTLAAFSPKYRDALEGVVPTARHLSVTPILSWRSVRESDATEVLEVVESSYFAGDKHFIDYNLVVTNNCDGPSKYTRTSREEILDMVRDKDSIFFCATALVNGTSDSRELEQKEQIVGCGFIKAIAAGRASGGRLKKESGTVNETECELGFLCTSQEFSRLGIGSQLVQHAFKLAKNAGYKSILIGVISHKEWLQEMYEQVGFEYVMDHKGNKVIEDWPKPVMCFLADSYRDTHFVKMRKFLDS
jgi:lysophosphatidylcholine acyltransferase / lyso-PAF acetyltransferase